MQPNFDPKQPPPPPVVESGGLLLTKKRSSSPAAPRPCSILRPQGGGHLTSTDMGSTFTFTSAAASNSRTSSPGDDNLSPKKRGRKCVSFGPDTLPPQESRLAVSITKHEVVRFPTNFVEYTVFVHEGGHPVKVLLRRYRQFERLHLDVRRESVVLRVPEARLPELPKKRWFSKQRWLNRWDEGVRRPLPVSRSFLSRVRLCGAMSPYKRTHVHTLTQTILLTTTHPFTTSPKNTNNPKNTNGTPTPRPSAAPDFQYERRLRLQDYVRSLIRITELAGSPGIKVGRATQY